MKRRLRLASLVAASALFSANPTAAPAINVAGYVDVGRDGAGRGPLVLAGDRGFAFASALSISDSLPGVYFGCNTDPSRCVPGATLDLHTEANSERGTATLDGATYYNVGSTNSQNGVSVVFDGSVILPALAPTAIVSASFTFHGQFSYVAAGSSERTDQPLAGSGFATVFLHSPGSDAFPNSWYVDRVLFEFGPGQRPGPSTAVDIGAVGRPGDTRFNTADGLYRVNGSGADIWGTKDAFHFYSFSLVGDGDVSVKVDSVYQTSPYAKAGVMLRESFDPASRHVILDVKPDGGVEFMTRSGTGGSTTYISGTTTTFPVWLRLTLNHGTLTGLMSSDGVSWVAVGTTTIDCCWESQLAGLAVTSHDNSTITQAIFEGPVIGLEWPWQHVDIGSVARAGGAASLYGRFVVSASGSDIWGTADSFHFMYQPVSGDGQIIARVDGEQNTSPFAKAGVMIRDGLEAGSTNVVLDVRPDGIIEFMARTSAGAATNFVAASSHAFPVWLRLVRHGATVTGFTSSDGSTWRSIGSLDVSMSTRTDFGLAVTSHDNSALNAATFTRVEVLADSQSHSSGPGDVVLFANDIPSTGIHGLWATASDSTSPSGVKLTTPVGSGPNTSAALAAPADYVDVTFNALAITYTLWLRIQATNNSKFSDSLWVQFSDAQVNGSAGYPIGTSSGLLLNLATDGTASSDQGWGWVNGAYWLVQPATVTFSSAGPHTLRLQPREYGVQVDQIILSPSRYLNPSASCPNACDFAPGSLSNDHTIVTKS